MYGYEYEYENSYEYERRQRKLAYIKRRRAAERKRRLIFLLLGVCIALTLAIIFGNTLAEAEAGHEDTVTYKYYTSIQLEPGDTLWDLAGEYMDEHYSSRQDLIREIEQLNSLTDTDDIVAGQMLVVPYYSTEYLN